MIKDQSHKPEGIFALPAIKTPSGIVVSQTPAICHVLGHELGLAPADAAADATSISPADGPWPGRRGGLR